MASLKWKLNIVVYKVQDMSQALRSVTWTKTKKHETTTLVWTVTSHHMWKVARQLFGQLTMWNSCKVKLIKVPLLGKAFLFYRIYRPSSNPLSLLTPITWRRQICSPKYLKLSQSRALKHVIHYSDICNSQFVTQHTVVSCLSMKSQTLRAGAP